MDQYNEFGGSVTSVEDLVKDMLGKVIGQFVPGGKSLVNMMMPMARGLTGNDVAWDTPVMTNMTSNGLYRHQLNTQMHNMEQIVSRNSERNATLEIVKDIERTKMAYADWQERNPELDEADYEAAISAKAEQAMRNKMYSGLVSMGNRTFNLDGTAGMGETIGHVASNLARPGSRRGDVNALAFGRYLAEDMFREAVFGYDINDTERKHLLPVFETDEKGNPSFISTRAKAYDRKEWGDFGQKAVSDLAANLSKDLDLIAGVDTKQADQISIASERFKAMLHEYARALEPLKDVFGEDMASMINTLEKMSGTTLAAMGPAAASAAANKLASRINTGQYTEQFLYQNIKDMGDALMTVPGMSSSMYLQRFGAGTLKSDFIQGAGVKPSYMTEEQWAAQGHQLALGVTMSKGTQALAEHYSVWARDRELKDPNLDRSWDEFRRQLEPMLIKGVDARAAAERLSGAHTEGQRRRGRAYSYFGEAIKNEDASMLSTYADLVDKRKSVAYLAMRDASMRDIISAETGRSDDKTADTVMDAVFSLMEQQPEMQNYSADSIMTAMNQLYNQGLTNVKLDKDSKEGINIANAVGAVVNYMKESEQGTYYKAYTVQSGLYGGALRQEKIRRDDEDRAKRMVAAQDAMFKSEDGIMQLFDGGFSYSKVMEKLEAGNAILNMNEQGKEFDPKKLDPENTAALVYAAGEIAQKKYGDDEEAVKAYAKRMFTYGKSAEAQSGKFQLELTKLRDAVEAGDWDAADMAEAKLDAYMTYGEAAVDKFLTSEGAYDKMREGFDLVAPNLDNVGRAVEAIENGTTVENLDIVKEAAANRRKPEYLAAMAMAAGEAARGKYGTDDAAAQAYAQRMFKYGTSAAGGSSRFQKALDEYSDATEHGDTNAAAKALQTMEAYMTYGESAVDKAMGFDKIYDRKGNGINLAPGSDERLAMLTKMDAKTLAMFNASQEVQALDDKSGAHQAAKDIFDKFLKTTSLKEGESVQDAWTSYRDKVMGDANIKSQKQREKFRRKYGDDMEYTDLELEQKRSAMQVLDNIMGVAGQGITPAAGQSDNLELVSVLRDLKDTLNRMITDPNGVLQGAPAKQVSSQDRTAR